jgi:hypothetical protein
MIGRCIVCCRQAACHLAVDNIAVQCSKQRCTQLARKQFQHAIVRMPVPLLQLRCCCSHSRPTSIAAAAVAGGTAPTSRIRPSKPSPPAAPLLLLPLALLTLNSTRAASSFTAGFKLDSAFDR